MLSKINRLPLRQEIGKMKASGTHFSGMLLNLVVNHRQDNLPSRFACIISTKVAKKAVDRNRIRRQIYGAVSTLLPEVRSGVDILIIAKGSPTPTPWDKLQNAVYLNLKKAGLIVEFPIQEK